MGQERREVWVAVVVLAASLFFFLHLWQSTDERIGAASPTTMPLVVTGAIAVLSAILLARNLGRLRAAIAERAERAKAAPAEADPREAGESSPEGDAREATTAETALEPEPSDTPAQRRISAMRGIGLVAWTILYLATLPWLGYLLTTAAYIGGLTLLFGNRSIVTILLLMIVTPLALQLFFERYMVILLPSGSLFS